MKTDLQPIHEAELELRHGHRFTIRSHMTSVTLLLTDEVGETVEFRGRLQNLSYGGAKLSLNGKISSGQVVRLNISVPSIDFETDREAVVRWQQPRDAASWWTGIEMSPKFDEQFVDRLAAANVLDRRIDQRYQVSKTAAIRGELGGHDQTITIVNFSKGGFCVKFDDPNTEVTQKRFMVKLPDGSEIPSRVMWYQHTEEGCFVGCAYFAPEGFKQMRSYAEPEKIARERQLRARRWKRFRPMSKWMAISVVVLACVQSVHFARRKPELLMDTWKSALTLWTDYVDQPIRSQLERLEE